MSLLFSVVTSHTVSLPVGMAWTQPCSICGAAGVQSSPHQGRRNPLQWPDLCSFLQASCLHSLCLSRLSYAILLPPRKGQTSLLVSRSQAALYLIVAHGRGGGCSFHSTQVRSCLMSSGGSSSPRPQGHFSFGVGLPMRRLTQRRYPLSTNIGASSSPDLAHPVAHGWLLNGKASACNEGDLVSIPGIGKIPWRREMATNCSTLAWRKSHEHRSVIGLQFMGSQTARHD